MSHLPHVLPPRRKVNVRLLRCECGGSRIPDKKSSKLCVLTCPLTVLLPRGCLEGGHTQPGIF